MEGQGGDWGKLTRSARISASSPPTPLPPHKSQMGLKQYLQTHVIPFVLWARKFTFVVDLCQAVFPCFLSVVSDAIIIKIQLIAAVSSWVDAEGDGVHLALRIQLSNVLLQLPFGKDRTFSDVNGAVIVAGVIPGGIEVYLHTSLDSCSKRHLFISEAVPLASSWEVHGSALLTYSKMINKIFLSSIMQWFA